jgi:predicted O-methyltransferase YrrM
MNARIKDIVQKLKIDCPNFECPDVGQTPPEIIHTLQKIKKRKPKIILEIGSARGGFIYLLSATLGNSDVTLITIDPYTKGTKYEKQFYTYKQTIEKLKHFYPKNNYFHIKGTSNSKKSIESLRKYLGEKKVNFLFIDGSHKYEAVLNDWENYSYFLDKKGLVAFHDIIAYDDVNKAWKKIILGQKDYQYEECKKEGVPLLTFANEQDKKKFGQSMILGVGYLYK